MLFGLVAAALQLGPSTPVVAPLKTVPPIVYNMPASVTKPTSGSQNPRDPLVPGAAREQAHIFDCGRYGTCVGQGNMIVAQSIWGTILSKLGLPVPPDARKL